MIRCRYIGHGQSKVTFILEERAEVLKLSSVVDIEPQVCKALLSRSEGEALCPAVLQSSLCEELDASGKQQREWLAWIAAYTPALNEVLQLPEIDRRACMMSALYVQVRAAQLGLLLSDNNLFNFGVALEFGGSTRVTDKRVWREKLAQQRSCVVILDTGHRRLVEPGAIDWFEQNKSCMKKWWKKLGWQAVHPSDYEEVCRVWRATWDINRLVDGLRGAHYCLVAGPVLDQEQEIVESRFTNALFVRELCRVHEDEEMLQWYLDTFLFGQLGTMYIASNGICLPTSEETPQAPYIKLDILLRVAAHQRGLWIEDANEVLTGDKYIQLHHAWMDDWKSWMTQEAQEEWYTKGNHHWTKSRFKNFMFKIAGSAELLQFFLYVPHTSRNFRIFYDTFRTMSDDMRRNERLMQAVEEVRRTSW